MSSRREGRDSDSKRHRSRFDQEPSPKRSRKHSRQETERPPTTHNLDGGNNSERDQKHHHRLQDAVPRDAPSAQDLKSERTLRKPSENVTVKDDRIKESSDPNEGSRHRSSKQSSNPSEVPRCTSSFQHDERGSAGQVDRSSRHKAATGEFPLIILAF
ncbi:hypothetical protein HAX54_009771 [Datura stramonium]|uniref:Uncharacterized protein n=1 Tax=Datura stramonium TaxID=4076 RepID=A0ABS8RWJ5_DATST|nr:hypothetical protein [Datura stramonium]